MEFVNSDEADPKEGTASTVCSELIAVEPQGFIPTDVLGLQ